MSFADNELLSEKSSRADILKNGHLSGQEDSYLEGYIQALVNAHYYEFDVIVVVKERVVCLYNLPKNELVANSIVSFVSDVPEVTSVKIMEGEPPPVIKQREEKESARVKGVWFPQSTLLYQPMIADPREVSYSVGYRLGDNVIGQKVIAISMGDHFPIFRWNQVGPWRGDLQIGIVAGIWSVFKMGKTGHNNEFSELVTTDYLVGIPLSYAFDKWAMQMRIYHVSSHLGDEFLVDNPGFERKNPSMEAIDFFTSYQVIDALRFYGGAGVVIHSDCGYHLKPLYGQIGGEVRLLGHKSFYHRLYGTPFLAVNLRFWQENSYGIDGTYQIGYEWSKLAGIGRKMRVFAEYHNGYSEGQFFKQRTSYVSFRLSYGF